MTKLSFFVFLFAALSAPGQSDTRHPTSAQFRAALETLKTSQGQWAKVINSVSVDELPVSYRIGKQIDGYRGVVNEDLRVLESLVDRVEREHSVYAEVNLVLAVQELQAQLNLFSATLSMYTIPDPAAQKKVDDWSQAITDIANGPLEPIYVTTVSFVTDRAHVLDIQCVNPRASEEIAPSAHSK